MDRPTRRRQIGEGDGENVSERVDEFVYPKIERRKLPRSPRPQSAQGERGVADR